MNPELLEVLACPEDQADLEYHSDDEHLVCSRCTAAYPVRDGIPVLLVDKTPAEPADAHS